MHLSITLGVADLDATLSFYQQIPDFTPQWITSESGIRTALMLPTKGCRLTFISLPQMERQHPALLQHLTRERLGSGMQLEFCCSDLAPLYDIATKQHWPILYELEDRQHQRRELWLQDPDGYLLIFNEET